MLCGWKHGQHNVVFAVAAVAAGPAQQNPVVVGQHLRATGPTCAHKRRKVHVDQPCRGPISVPSPNRLARLACPTQLRKAGRAFNGRYADTMGPGPAPPRPYPDTLLRVADPSTFKT